MFAPGEEQTYDNRAAVLGWSWTQRRLDSPIFPSKGYIVSVQFLSRSIESWFDVRMDKALEGGLNLARLSGVGIPTDGWLAWGGVVGCWAWLVQAYFCLVSSASNSICAL